MANSYISIFDRNKMITKKDLCEILNLDPSRPKLMFSKTEINKAYKKRLLRVHPDKQRNLEQPIPKKIALILTNDATRAKDYLLNGESNIPGKAFKENLNINDLDSLFDFLVSSLKQIKPTTESIASLFTYLRYASNNFVVLILLSTYSDNHLNFRYINDISKALNIIRPFIKQVNGAAIANILRSLQKALISEDNDASEAAFDSLKQSLPDKIANNAKYDKLILEIKNISEDLKPILDDGFIYRTEIIFNFWPHFIATVPNWKHIIGIYFISMLFSATTLPKFINAYFDISNIVLKQKGKLAFGVFLLPSVLLTILLLPINIATHLTLQGAYLSSKVLYRVISNVFQAFITTCHLIKMALFDTNLSFREEAYKLFEALINLSFRLFIISTLEIVDSFIYVFSGTSPLVELISSLHEKFDNFLLAIKPATKVKIKKELDEEAEQSPLIAINDKSEETAKQQSLPSTVENPQGFFNNPFVNSNDAKDPWLEEALATMPQKNAAENKK